MPIVDIAYYSTIVRMKINERTNTGSENEHSRIGIRMVFATTIGFLTVSGAPNEDENVGDRST